MIQIRIDPMHAFMRQISVTYRCAMLYREKELADTGLSGCQTPYLVALYRMPGISQEELARYLNVNKSSVARQLANLEKQDYVRREPSHADRRSLLVYPTEKAMQLRDRLFRVLFGWSDYLTEDFTPEEKEQLLCMMRRVADRAEAYVKGGACACAPSDDT